jgi:hypothetical protein
VRVLAEPDARSNPAIVLRAVRRCERFLDDGELVFVRGMARPISPDDHERLIAILERIVQAKKSPTCRTPPDGARERVTSEVNYFQTDACAVCHRPFERGDTLWKGKAGGVTVEVGVCCAKKLERRTAVGVYHPPWRRNDDRGLWHRDDARFFERNPHRSHRLRRAFAGEVAHGAPDGNKWHVVVRQVSPDARRLLDFFAARDFPDDEELARAFFDAIAARHAKGGDPGAYAYLDDALVRLLTGAPTPPNDGGAA